jgi:hypothetical protein
MMRTWPSIMLCLQRELLHELYIIPRRVTAQPVNKRVLAAVQDVLLVQARISCDTGPVHVLLPDPSLQHKHA